MFNKETMKCPITNQSSKLLIEWISFCVPYLLREVNTIYRRCWNLTTHKRVIYDMKNKISARVILLYDSFCQILGKVQDLKEEVISYISW